MAKRLIQPVQWSVALALLSCATANPPSSQPAPPPPAHQLPQEPVPALRLPSDVKPTHYALNLQIDPDQAEFSGSAAIDLMFSAPRDVLWVHGLDLKVKSSALKVGGEVLAVKWEQVNDDGVVRLQLPHVVGPGPATLEVSWTRGYDPRLVGLYLAKEGGNTYAYTQFEDIYARRAFPGFDEPGFKTSFDVTLEIPATDVAATNTPQLSEELKGDHKRIHFATTKPLPTYLLAWAVGPFDVVEAEPLPPNAIRSWPVPLRGVAPKGRGSELAWGLQTARELLLLEEQYFGVPYAYPKLDSIVVPDYAFGAMENAGAIHYREDLFLFKDGVSSEEGKLGSADTIAHEQAHQWFGDLVTMPWWEDAWLNESFATWMATQMVQRWKPEWNAGIDLQKASSGAMGADALVTARAIRQPLASVKDIMDQFDGQTYQKGGAVLAMFERAMGPEVFRRGVSGYIAAHANGSGSTEDLLDALSAAAGHDVKAAFHTFLDQAGVPLVQAQVACGAKAVLTLKQSRYFPLGSTGKQDRAWQIPVCLRFGKGAEIQQQCLSLTQAEQQVELPMCPDWLLPNADGAGYYQWSMAGQDLQKLRTAGYAKLTVAERISLAQALRAGVAAGAIPIADALGALGPIAQDADSEVIPEAMPLLFQARDHLLPPEETARVDAFTSRLFAPVLARVGFSAKQGEPAATRRLRRRVLEMLAHVEDKAVVAELTRRGLAYAGLADKTFHPEAVDADLAGLALSTAVKFGNLALFDTLTQRLATLDDAEIRSRVVSALASVTDPDRAAKALALTLDLRLRKQEALTPVFAMADEPKTRDAAWKYLTEHFEQAIAASPESSAAYLPWVITGFCDAERAKEQAAFLEPRAPKYSGMGQNVRQALEAEQLCAATVAAQRQSARAFFANNKPGK